MLKCFSAQSVRKKYVNITKVLRLYSDVCKLYINQAKAILSATFETSFGKAFKQSTAVLDT